MERTQQDGAARKHSKRNRLSGPDSTHKPKKSRIRKKHRTMTEQDMVEEAVAKDEEGVVEVVDKADDVEESNGKSEEEEDVEEAPEIKEVAAAVADGRVSASSAVISPTTAPEGSSAVANRRAILSSSRRTSVYANMDSYVPGYSIKLFSPPRQRQKWDDDQIIPRVNWGDLFFDLFYVGGFYNLGNILVTTPSGTGLLYFLSCFFPIMQLWEDKMYYDSRFVYGDDIYHRIFEIVVLVVLATSISYIAPVEVMADTSSNVEMFGFALSITLNGFLNIVRSIECILFGRGQRKPIECSSKLIIKWKSFVMCFYGAAAIIAGIDYFGNDDDDDNHRLLAGGAGDGECNDSAWKHLPITLILIGFTVSQIHIFVMIVFCFPKNGEHKKFMIPMNIDFCIHRHGEWTMLVLGESILSLLIVDATSHDYYSAFYCGIITVILMQYLHFRSQPHNPDLHAWRRSKDAGALYGQMNYWYSAALIIVGASYKLFLYDFNENGGHRLLSTMQRVSFLKSSAAVDEEDMTSRLLAGGTSSCGPFGNEKEQNIAYLFCGAMAIVFFCMDVIVLAHVGLEREVGKCRLKDGVCVRTGQAEKAHLNTRGILLVCFRCGITIFMATLSLYVTDPRRLAEIGLAAVVCQLLTRFLGDIFFPDDVHFGDSHHHHEGIEDEYDEEYKWPNVTHAQAVETK